jgi:DNA processing protein
LFGEEDAIFQRLSIEPLSIDQLAERTGLTVSLVGGLLTMLEVKGLARRLPGQYFISTVMRNE